MTDGETGGRAQPRPRYAVVPGLRPISRPDATGRTWSLVHVRDPLPRPPVGRVVDRPPWDPASDAVAACDAARAADDAERAALLLGTGDERWVRRDDAVARVRLELEPDGDAVTWGDPRYRSPDHMRGAAAEGRRIADCGRGPGVCRWSAELGLVAVPPRCGSLLCSRCGRARAMARAERVARALTAWGRPAVWYTLTQPVQIEDGPVALLSTEPDPPNGRRGGDAACPGESLAGAISRLRRNLDTWARGADRETHVALTVGEWRAMEITQAADEGTPLRWHVHVHGLAMPTDVDAWRRDRVAAWCAVSGGAPAAQDVQTIGAADVERAARQAAKYVAPWHRLTFAGALDVWTTCAGMQATAGHGALTARSARAAAYPELLAAYRRPVADTLPMEWRSGASWEPLTLQAIATGRGRDPMIRATDDSGCATLIQRVSWRALRAAVSAGPSGDPQARLLETR